MFFVVCYGQRSGWYPLATSLKVDGFNNFDGNIVKFLIVFSVFQVENSAETFGEFCCILIDNLVNKSALQENRKLIYDLTFNFISMHYNHGTL